MTRRAIGVSERPPLLQTIPLSLQHLFAMFGATVLVPILFHINPATVLLFNGIGTLLYLFICKAKSRRIWDRVSPLFLQYCCCCRWATKWRWVVLLCAACCSASSPLLSKAGTGWLDVMFPPAAWAPSWRLSASNWRVWRLIWPGCCQPTVKPRQQNHYYFDGNAGGDGIWFCAVPRLPRRLFQS